MPHWTVAEEKQLLEMLPKAVAPEDLAGPLKRTPDAIAKKLKRMGLAFPERLSAIPEGNKVTKDTPSTTPKLEALKFGELPSPNEALGLLWAAIGRLQEPGVSKEEVKRLRIVIQGVKSYIRLERLRKASGNV